MQALVQTEFKEMSQGTNEALIIHEHTNSLRDKIIVLVHGLGGTRYGLKSTWGRIPYFLFEDFPQLDIGLYEYSTLFHRWKFWESVPLEAEATSFANLLRESHGYKEILLVGHSLGGLLCMAALQYFYASNQKEELKRIRGLYLMATPQTGSQRVPKVFSWLSKDFYALRPHGRFVTDVQRTLTNAFILDENLTSPDRILIPTWAVLGNCDFWVDRLSAALNLPDRRCMQVRGSHTSIVKPTHKSSECYEFLKQRIALALKEKAASSELYDILRPIESASIFRQRVSEATETLLPNKLPLVNREYLRERVREYLDPEKGPGRILVIPPSTAAGKSHSQHLLRHTAHALDLCFVFIDCLKERSGVEVAQKIANEIGVSTGYEELRKQLLDASRPGMVFKSWLKGRLPAPRRAWIVFDHVVKPKSATEVESIALELAEAATLGEFETLYITLIDSDYTPENAGFPGLGSFFRDNPVDPLTPDDVATFMVRWANGVGKRLTENDAAMEAKGAFQELTLPPSRETTVKLIGLVGSRLKKMGLLPSSAAR
jgi:pimeloyl-ACP methyl ester carboxylesterase